MSNQRLDILNISTEFRIACVLNNLEMQQVLQIFIDHVSFYFSLCEGYLPGYTEATRVISEFSVRKDKNSQTQIDKNLSAGRSSTWNREMSIKYIRQLIKLAYTSSSTESVKHKKSLNIVNKLFNAMGNLQVCPECIYLDEHRKLIFNSDFRIICEMHNISPKFYLEYFMARISLAEIQARISLNAPTDNGAMTIFFKILNGLGGIHWEKLTVTEEMVNYIDAVQQLNAAHYIIRNLEKRISVYREFYLYHYNQITKTKI